MTRKRPVHPDPLSVAVPASHAWHGQLRHAVLLALLLPGAWALAEPCLGGGRWLGLSDTDWFVAALTVPVIQQVVVVLVWRAQMCRSTFTRAFGDRALAVWGALFFPLLIARPVAIVGVGAADVGSAGIPAYVGVPLGVAFLLVAAWTMHSVAKHFGFPRALGGDHFFERYRAMPFVRKGAFAVSSNAMYSLGFLGLWGIALLFRSRAALAAALFQQAYIWVHWYCTEQPDAVVLYGRDPATDD